MRLIKFSIVCWESAMQDSLRFITQISFHIIYFIHEILNQAWLLICPRVLESYYLHWVFVVYQTEILTVPMECCLSIPLSHVHQHRKWWLQKRFPRVWKSSDSGSIDDAMVCWPRNRHGSFWRHCCTPTTKEKLNMGKLYLLTFITICETAVKIESEHGWM